MKKLFKKSKLLLMFFSFFIVAGLGYFGFSKSNLPIQLAQAGVYDPAVGTGHNLSGFAWNSNIGWISFNSTSDGSSNDYGVYIDSDTGDISGFAWSENVGWISFNRDTNYCAGGINIGKACAAPADCPGSSCNGDPSGATGDPLYPPYDSTTGAIAKYNVTAHTINGWAKILSMGDDGWISFNCSNNGDTCLTSNYKVSADVANSELDGWAWNGNDDGTGIGWISFNADNCNNNGSTYDGTPSGCPSNGTPFHDYKVEAQLNQKPTVDNLSAPNWSGNNGDACTNDDALRARLSWTIHDDNSDTGKAYQIVIDKTDLGSNPVGADFDTGKCLVSNGVVGDCIINVGVGINLSCLKDGGTGGQCHYNLDDTIWPGFNYNESYYWWVRVWDNLDQPSDWVQYNTNSLSDTDKNSDGKPKTFTTYKHEFPQPYFTWTPAQPAIGEDTLFISRDLSKYATDSHTDANLDCEFLKCFYRWEDHSEEENYKINSYTSSSTIIEFKTKSNNVIDLYVKDSDDYECSTSTSFNIEQKLPTWIEAR